MFPCINFYFVVENLFSSQVDGFLSLRQSYNLFQKQHMLNASMLSEVVDEREVFCVPLDLFTPKMKSTFLLCVFLSQLLHFGQTTRKTKCLPDILYKKTKFQKPSGFDSRSYRAVYEYTDPTYATYEITADLFEENYDSRRKLYSVQWKNNDQIHTFIEDSTGQTFFVSPGGKGGPSCVVNSIPNNVTFLAKLPHLKSQKMHPYYLMQLLRLDKKSLKGFWGMKRQDERSLEAEQWDYCVDDNMTLVSTFWSPPPMDLDSKGHYLDQTPLWIEIRSPYFTGVRTINIFEFQLGEFNPSALMVPKGIYCPGRKPSKKFPIDPYKLHSFSFRVETIQNYAHLMLWSNHWFSLMYYSQRIDYPMTDTNVPEFVSEILNYEIGYGFTFSHDTGKCQVQRISKMKNFNSILKDIHYNSFKNPYWILGDKNTVYTYIGNDRVSRGYETEVYQTMRHDFPPGFRHSSAVVELYFTHTGQDFHSVPVKMAVYGVNESDVLFRYGSSVIHEIYDWRVDGPDEQDVSTYDVSMCYSDKYKKDLMFQLAVSLKDASGFKDTMNHPMFLHHVKDRVANAAKTDLFRITNIKVIPDFKRNTAFVAFTLLGIHPQIKLRSGEPDLTASLLNLNVAVDKKALFVMSANDKSKVYYAVPHSLTSLINPKFVSDHSTTVTAATTSGTNTPKIVTKNTKATRKTTEVAGISTTATKSTRSHVTASTPATKSTRSRVTSSTPIIMTSSGNTRSHTHKSTSHPGTTAANGNTKTQPNSQKRVEKKTAGVFTPGVLGGAAIGALIGGTLVGGASTFVQIKYFGGKVFGIKVI